jgi:hypothetical protein
MIDPPQFLAGPLVEGNHVRGLIEMVPDHHQRVAVQDRCRAFAELIAHLLVAEVGLPDQFAAHVVGVEAAGLEVGKNVRAVGDRRA